MKNYLLFFFLCFGCVLGKAQFPTIHATTIIPQSPTPSDIVKIVTHVTTPNQGIIVDLIHNVTHNPKEITLRPCYWQGMLTAIQTHIDTFIVGQLQAGVYTIKHKAYMSSTQQHCTKIDSNMVVSTLTVGGIAAGIKDIEQGDILSYPNPVSDKLYLKGYQPTAEAEIYSVDGRLVGLVKPDEEVLNLAFLEKGIYILRFVNQTHSSPIKFIKE